MSGGIFLLADNNASPERLQGGNNVVSVVAAALPGVVTVVNEIPPRPDSEGRLVGRVDVGTGFVVDARGYVVTNQHVVRDEGTLRVILESGDERPARLISHDAPFTDLAVLRIPAGNLTVLPVGNSERLVPGESIIAIGSSLSEYRNSVTVGVVSGLHRRWLRQGVYQEDLVQTDVALNSGNSGGPLLNLQGEVVGINSSVVRSFGGSENVQAVSFSISSRVFEPIAATIIERGAFPRPYFGIEHLNIDDEVRASTRLPVPDGAIVTAVFPDSPAAKAGIRTSDILLSLGRREINDEQPFINVLSRFGANERIDVALWREGRVQTLAVQLVER